MTGYYVAFMQATPNDWTGRLTKVALHELNTSIMKKGIVPSSNLDRKPTRPMSYTPKQTIEQEGIAIMLLFFLFFSSERVLHVCLVI